MGEVVLLIISTHPSQTTIKALHSSRAMAPLHHNNTVDIINHLRLRDNMATRIPLHNSTVAIMVHQTMRRNMADQGCPRCTRTHMPMATPMPLLPLLPVYKTLEAALPTVMHFNIRTVLDEEKRY